ncbi:MAG: hypothetical protein ACLT98_02695 [Eggerthellaceae bacterium]
MHVLDAVIGKDLRQPFGMSVDQRKRGVRTVHPSSAARCITAAASECWG